MKKFYTNFIALLILCTGFSLQSNAQMLLTGVFDFDLSGGTPKGVELYVLQDIPDLSIYGVGTANNGSGTDGQEFTFPAVSATAGDYIYLSSESTQFTAYFGFAPDYTSGIMGINGDDAVELFQNGLVIDTYGDPNVNGDFEVWDYTDSWAYRIDNTSANPTFDSANWTFAGRSAADGCGTTNAACVSVMPIGTFAVAAPEPTIATNGPAILADCTYDAVLNLITGTPNTDAIFSYGFSSSGPNAGIQSVIVDPINSNLGSLPSGSYSIFSADSTLFFSINTAANFTTNVDIAADVEMTNGDIYTQFFNFTYTTGASLEASISVDAQPSCFGAQDGSLTVGVTSGVGPYSYIWSTGDTDASISGLISGNYTCTITDQTTSLSIVESAVLVDPAEIVLSITGTQDITGLDNGSISLSITNGNPDFVINSIYSINGSVVSTTNTDITGFAATLENLGAGDYSLFATDNDGCQSASVSVTLIDLCDADAGDLSYNGAATLCEGETIGEFSADYSAADETLPNIILPPGNPVITEIRIDHSGTDTDEYAEIYASPGTSLDGYTYIVIGDGSTGDGTIERVISLDNNVVGSSGYFVLASNGFSIGTADILVGTNIFENSDNVTHLLVQGFTGSNGDDLDTNDDGTLDSTPWSSINTAISLVESVGTGDAYYAAQLGGVEIGPDGNFVPGHVYFDGTTWVIGSFALGQDDTPGSGPFASSANFSYFWMLTSGAPDYTIIETVQGSVLAPFTAEFDNVAAGTYCVVGMMFEGDADALNALGYTNALDAKADADAGTTCADVNLDECISITVEEAATADAGADFNICSDETIELLAIANGDGEWTGGLGSFADATATSTTYTADASEVGTTVSLTWTTFALNASCTDVSDEINITIDILPDSEFTYAETEICPNGDEILPVHTTGVDGYYSYTVLAGGPNLSLDAATGAVDAAASDQGTYEITNLVSAQPNLILTGMMDGPLPGGRPKALELYVTADIADLSNYGIGSATNGNPGNGEDFEFPATFAAAGTYIYVTALGHEADFNAWFGFDADYTSSALFINGDDAMELFFNNTPIDAIGVVGEDGTNKDWEYTDGWIYRNDNTAVTTSFNIADWSVSGPNALDNETSNTTAATPFPTGAFTTNVSSSACQNSTTSVTITIGDDVAPVIVCPADILVNLDPGACEAIVDFEVAATDNCYDNLVITQTDATGLASGDAFYYGTYTLSFSTTDGNNNSADCSFNVTVNEYANPTATLTCNDNLQVSLDENGEGFINADFILEGGPYGCYDDYIVEIFTSNGQNMGQIADCSMVGSTVNVMVTDPDTGNTCWGSISVEDKINPVVTCIDYSNISCTFNLNALPGASATDNCDVFPTIELISEIIDESGNCSDGEVLVYRSYRAVDAQGNASDECTSVITVIRPNGITFPADAIIACADYDTNNGLTDPAFTGIPLDLDGVYCQYTYTYSDQVFEACGETFKINRTWTVLDLCSNNVETFVQLISVVDDIAPVITTEGIILGTDGNNCSSNGFIPAPLVSDNCSDYTLTIFSTVGELIYANGVNGNEGGFIPADGLDLGNHVITFYAEDACGNISSAQTTVSIIDNVSPTVICDAITDVNLNSSGVAEVFTETFDDGTYDNCCLDLLQVRRMDTGFFGESVTFDCDDSEVMVVLRAFDCYGNFSECMVTALVNDKINPIALCPTDTEISCDEYYTDFAPALDAEDWAVLDVFGAATLVDNCDFEETYSVSYNVDQCGEGSIIRTWSATDASGNGPASCSQTISVFHVSDWNISFPADFDQPVDADCNYNEIDFGEPSISNDECEMIAVSYTDTQFDVPGQDACLKIFRDWTVINWCTYDAVNSSETLATASSVSYNVTGSDYITYTQVVKVKDDVAPIVSTEDFVAQITEGCGVNITLDDITIEGGCSNDVYNIILNDGDLSSYGSNGNYVSVPFGTYEISYTVVDPCGNSATTLRTVIVEDKLPTAYCVDALVITIMQTGMVEVPAIDFDAGSFDNCGDIVSFTYDEAGTMPLMQFDCDGLGLNIVTVYVTDEAGNTDFCEVIVDVQDNLGVCDDTPMVTLAGSVATEEGVTVENAMMDVNNGLNTVYTDSNGYYEMEVEQDGDYSIGALLDENPEEGVTTYDLVIISQHILGLNILNSPYKLIAADANNSGTISTLDLVSIRKVILQIEENFQNNTSWRFVDADYNFADPLNPWSNGFPELININNIDADYLDADFVAVKIGDVNGSYEGSNFSGSQNRSTSSITFTSEDNTIIAGESFSVELNTKELLSGFQFTLDFDTDKLTFESVEEAKLTNANFGFSKVADGALTVSWNDFNIVDFSSEDEQIVLNFSAKQNVTLSEALNVSSRYTKAEAYGVNAELFDIVLDFGTKADGITLLQNEPNPFSGLTTIGFYLSNKENVRLKVVDMSGKLVKFVSIDAEAGFNTVSIASEDLGDAGVYYYTLTTSEESLTKKMVSIK